MTQQGALAADLEEKRRKRQTRVALGLLIGALPNCNAKRVLMRVLLGWQVSQTATVGPCVLLNVENVALRPYSQIWAFSVFHNLASLSLGERAVVGHWNWVGAAPMLRTSALMSRAAGRAGAFRLGKNAAVTSRHYIDCSGGVEIGDFSILAGVRSTVMTHQVDTTVSAQDVCGVVIDEYCFVGSNVKLVPGAKVPSRSVVAMGSVVTRELDQPGMLYAGAPARPIRRVDHGAYFLRHDGFVDIP